MIKIIKSGILSSMLAWVWIHQAWAANNISCVTCLTLQESSTKQMLDAQKVHDLNAELKNMRANDDYGMTLFKLDNEIVKGIAGLVPILGGVTNVALGKLEEVAQGKVNEAAAKRLDRRLGELLNAGKTPHDLHANATDIIESLLGENSQFYKDLDLKRSEYDVMQDYAIKALAKRVDELTKHQVKAKDLIRAGKTEAELKAMKSDIKELLATKRELQNNGVNEMQATSTEVEKTADEVVKKNIAADEAQQEFNEQMKQFSTSAEKAAKQFASASRIMGKLGVPQDTVDAVADVGGVLEISAGVAASFTDPFLILPTVEKVFGLFGKPPVDPMRENMKKIMEALAQLQKDILQQHKETLKGLNAIQESLWGISSYLTDGVAERADVCEWGGTFGPNGEVKARWSWVNTPNDPPATVINADQLRPASFVDIQRIWGAHSTQITLCLNALDTFYPPTISGVHDFDVLDGKNSGMVDVTKADSKTKAKLWLNSWIVQTQNLYQHINDNTKVLLFVPVASASDLDWKINHMDQMPGAIIKRTEEHNPGLFTTLNTYAWEIAVDADSVAHTAAFVVMNNWWNDFIQKGDISKTYADSLKNSSEVGNIRLNSTLDMMQLAMAQQSAISGDLLLAIAYEKLSGDTSLQIRQRMFPEEKAVPGTDAWWNNNALGEIVGWINSNTLLKNNMGIFFAHRRMLDPTNPNRSLFGYQVAYAAVQDPTWMSRILNCGGCSVTWHDANDANTLLKNRWAVNLGEVELPLPGPKALEDAIFFQTRSFNTLAIVREQLNQELSHYDFVTKPDKASLEDIKAAAKAGFLQ